MESIQILFTVGHAMVIVGQQHIRVNFYENLVRHDTSFISFTICFKPFQSFNFGFYSLLCCLQETIYSYIH